MKSHHRATRRARLVGAFVVAAFAIAGCGANSPSLLDTHGSESKTIAGIWWLMFILGAAVYAVVATLIIWALVRGRRRAARDGRLTDDTWVVWGGVIIPVLILGVLAVVTVRATSQLRRPDVSAVKIEVVGERWWWQVSYPGFTTANEIHLPAGQPVEIGLDSDNVIHSFWVPQLAGKVDMIPGQHNVLRFTPRTPGVYRGECAEFCGIEHARMDFVVVVDSPAEFLRWEAREQNMPTPPDGESQVEGEAVFMNGSCAGCHTIRGTQAEGQVGPDLTEIASRKSIAANTIPNTSSNLAAWITNPQAIKPGALMPPIPLSSRDLSNLIAYLESLK